MAIKRVTEKRMYKYQEGVGGDSGNFVDKEYEYDHITGYYSDVTGETYAADQRYVAQPNSRMMMLGFNSPDVWIDSAYDGNRMQEIKTIEWDAQLKQQAAAAAAQQQQQREAWAAEQQATLEQFNRDQAAAKQAQADQVAAFEAERVAREQAKAEAERVKQEKLATERKISGATVLGDMLRVGKTTQSDLVAEEDKKVLTGDDKNALFGSETDEVKAKQTFLERLLSSKPSVAAKQ